MRARTRSPIRSKAVVVTDREYLRVVAAHSMLASLQMTSAMVGECTLLQDEAPHRSIQPDRLTA